MNKADSSRKERNRERRRQSLIEAATHLFATHGYAGTTIDDIVDEADVAKVTFYSYFKSKEEIALEIKRRGREEALEYIESLSAKHLPVEAMIEAFITDVADWTAENYRLLDVFCHQRFNLMMNRDTASEIVGDQECSSLNDNSSEGTISQKAVTEKGETTHACRPEPITICVDVILKRGQDTGVFRTDFDRMRIAHLFDLAILCEQYHWVRIGRPEGELKKQLQGYFDFALRGLRIG